jgi:hypothetical protein
MSSSIMLEDTLIYNPARTQIFAALLEADLVDDERDFYLRMARDISIVAEETRRPTEGIRLSESLLAALVATPTARKKAWRRFYRGIRTLASGFAPAYPDEASRELVPAFGRLRQFVRENADLADTLVIADLDQAAYCHLIGA